MKREWITVVAVVAGAAAVYAAFVWLVPGGFVG